jgi:hypothetical protein
MGEILSSGYLNGVETEVDLIPLLNADAMANNQSAEVYVVCEFADGVTITSNSIILLENPVIAKFKPNYASGIIKKVEILNNGENVSDLKVTTEQYDYYYEKEYYMTYENAESLSFDYGYNIDLSPEINAASLAATLGVPSIKCWVIVIFKYEGVEIGWGTSNVYVCDPSKLLKLEVITKEIRQCSNCELDYDRCYC